MSEQTETTTQDVISPETGEVSVPETDQAAEPSEATAEPAEHTLESLPCMNGTTPVEGIYTGIPEALYHIIPAMRSTTAKKALKSLATVRAALDSKAQFRTKALTVGDAIHAAILEPERFAEQYSDTPVKPENAGWLDGSAELREAISTYNASLEQPLEITKERADLLAAYGTLPEAFQTVQGDLAKEPLDKPLEVPKERDELVTAYGELPEAFQTVQGDLAKLPLAKVGGKPDLEAALTGASIEVPEKATVADLKKLIDAYNADTVADALLRDAVKGYHDAYKADIVPNTHLREAIKTYNDSLPKPYSLSGTMGEMKARILEFNPEAKFWDEARAEFIGDRAVLNDLDYQMCIKMESNAREHKLASRVLAGGQAEVTLIWRHRTGMWCKARLDYLVQTESGHNVILDLKSSTHDINKPRSVARTIENYGYEFSAAFYADGLEVLTGEAPTFGWVFVEKDSPYQLRLWQASDRMMLKGHNRMEMALAEIAHAEKTGHWPGYPEEFTLIDPIEDQYKEQSNV